MKHGLVVAWLVLLLSAGAGWAVIAAPDAATPDEGTPAMTAPPAMSQEQSKESDKIFEAWAREHAGPWMACAILGTYLYVKYLLDKSNWVTLVLFSRYLETGDCFYRDLEWAAEIYREGAKAGREVHALYLGHLYLKGLGVKRDTKEARRWFDLGVLYQIDADRKYQIDHTKWIMGHRGMPPELMDAIKRGRKKLEGDGAEILRVARWLRIGIRGMTQNLTASARLYRTAHLANKLHLRLKFDYYELLWTNAFQTSDRTVRQSEVMYAARGMLELAALYEHRRAEKFLAEFFTRGEWVPKNLFAAYVLYRAAQNNGLDVVAQINHIRPNLSAEQISQVEDEFRKRGSFVVIYFLQRFEKLLENN
jgi:TPR repeat protein